MKYLKYIALSLCLAAGFTSCDDDDDATAPRLFRPVSTLTAKTNNVVVTWDLIKGATSYELVLFKDSGEETEAGVSILKEYRKESVATSPFTFADVEWDEKYSVRIKAIGNNIESEYYNTSSLSVIYPTKLSTIRTVDESALITWKEGGNAITSLKIVLSKDPTNEITVSVSEGQFNNGEIVVSSLTQNSEYLVYAYSGESQSMDTYEGRSSFKTRKSEDFKELYGEGKYIDLRNEFDANVLNSSEFRSLINATEGMTVILKGGFEYNISSALSFEKSITFRTGLSLEGNAKLINTVVMQLKGNLTVNKVAFEGIDFISSTIHELKSLAEWKNDKNFGGKQIFNINNTNSILNEINFKECSMIGYRAIVRLQTQNDAIKKVVIDGCTVDGVGDQGVVTTTNLAGTMDEIIINNSTFTNIALMADLRKTKNKPTMTISNTTFCYVQFEGYATPLFRFDSNPADLIFENTIFGPTMGTVGQAGVVPIVYSAGKKEAILIDTPSATGFTLAAKNSFKTNFAVTEGKDISGLMPLSMDEKTLFADPENAGFTIKTAFDGASSAGALKWRMP